MIKLPVKPAEDLKNCMIKYSLTKSAVADYTSSSVRSVERWMLNGIPVPKWDLLMLKIKYVRK